MRYFKSTLLLTISVLLVFVCKAQNIESFKSENSTLKNKKNELLEQVKTLKSKIDSIDEIINFNIIQIENDKITKLALKTIKVSPKKNISVYDIKSIANGKVIFTIPKKKEIELLDYKNDFWLIKYNKKTGWVFYPSFTGIQEADKFKEEIILKNKWLKEKREKRSEDEYLKRIEKEESDAKEEKKKEQERIDSDKLLLKEAKVRAKVIRDKEKLEKEKYIKKEYGKFASDILLGSVIQGMSKKMVVESIGQPSDKNITEGSFGVHEQWVYDKKKMYLYFENGKLTTIQY